MWLGLLVLIVILLAIIGGLAVGGVYLVVLVPVAVVIAVAYIAYAMSKRSSEPVSPTDAAAAEDAPLPHSGRRNTAAAPSTPDDLVDARQHQ